MNATGLFNGQGPSVNINPRYFFVIQAQMVDLVGHVLGASCRPGLTEATVYVNNGANCLWRFPHFSSVVDLALFNFFKTQSLTANGVLKRCPMLSQNAPFITAGK